MSAATDGAEALGILENSPGINILISDVVLPGGISGIELANLIGQRDADMKILLMSGYSEEAVMSEGLVNSGIKIMNKPFTRYELSRNVRNTLDGVPAVG